MAKLKKVLTSDPTLNQVQTNVSLALDELSSLPILSGSIVRVSLSTDPIRIEHRLGRMPLGWFPIRKTEDVNLWEVSLDPKGITLQADQDTTLTLFIF